MAKQQFCCKGVLRATGQKVTITVAADNKDAAIRLAGQHGVQVDQVLPVAAPQTQPPTAPSKPVEKKDVIQRIDDILDEEDDDADDFDLDDADDPARSPNTLTTKACPYCGEQILAVAVKCKHCGSYVGKQREPKRVSEGEKPSGSLARLLWMLAAGVGSLVLIVVILMTVILANRDSAVAPVLPVTLSEATPPVAPVPKAEAPTPPATPQASAEEMAFAAGLSAFLDGCDKMTRMLGKSPTVEQYRTECESLKKLHAAIPAAPQGVDWAEQAASGSRQILGVTDMLIGAMELSEARKKALGKTMGENDETGGDYRQTARMVREIVATVRGLIPPACKAKG